MGNLTSSSLLYAKKVASDSLGLVDLANELVNSVLNLPDKKVFGEFKLQKNCNINPAHQKQFYRLVEMTFGLVHASYSCKTDSLCTLRLVVCVASVSAQVNAQMWRKKKTNGGEESNFIAASD